MKSGLIRSFPLETDTTVNASWHVSTWLPQVFKAVSERRETRGLIFHHDNVRPRRACITNGFFLENHVEEYPNPPYSSRFKPLRLLLIPQTQESVTWNSVYRRQRNMNCFRTSHW
ncbi:unnamed protein product [Rotaria socialis]|uniref:Uncharacterized protein n=1 Tax=Rotaria socialis TaxID=392032 RepID=A0A821FQI5_9BILA|nr:unnamed protein product [Rotaria socialis]CAF4655153.1 unnamed protein product [Rotaria socialis]